MPNGIEWTKDELRRFSEPLETVDHVLSAFAHHSGTRVNRSTYHGYLSRTISFQEKSQKDTYFLIKSIHLILKKKEWPPTYGLFVTVHTAYGLRDILSLIPFIRGLVHPRKQMRWETTVRTFSPRIDPDQLSEALKQAEDFLDSFDERRFSPEKSVSGTSASTGKSGPA